jgi:hypothetical protein
MLLIVLVLAVLYLSSIHSYKVINNKWNVDTKLYGGGFGKPSTSSSFKYVGNVKPGIRGPKRIVDPSIMRPDYAETGNMYI